MELSPELTNKLLGIEDEDTRALIAKLLLEKAASQQTGGNQFYDFLFTVAAHSKIFPKLCVKDWPLCQTALGL